MHTCTHIAVDKFKHIHLYYYLDTHIIATSWFLKFGVLKSSNCLPRRPDPLDQAEGGPGHLLHRLGDHCHWEETAGGGEDGEASGMFPVRIVSWVTNRGYQRTKLLEMAMEKNNQLDGGKAMITVSMFFMVFVHHFEGIFGRHD